MLIAGPLFGPHHSIIENFMKSGQWFYAKTIAEGTGIERTTIVLALEQMMEAGLVIIKKEIRKYRYLEPSENEVKARLGEAIFAKCNGLLFGRRSEPLHGQSRQNAQRRPASLRRWGKRKRSGGKRGSTRSLLQNH